MPVSGNFEAGICASRHSIPKVVSQPLLSEVVKQPSYTERVVHSAPIESRELF
jgi:hypothetical protein